VHLAALAADIPDAVSRRRSKATVDHLIEQVLDSALPSMLTQLLHCGIDWIEPSGLNRLMQEYNRAPGGQKPLFELWAAVGCGILFAQ
jgi:hypothetical protein